MDVSRKGKDKRDQDCIGSEGIIGNMILHGYHMISSLDFMHYTKM